MLWESVVDYNSLAYKIEAKNQLICQQTLKLYIFIFIIRQFYEI